MDTNSKISLDLEKVIEVEIDGIDYRDYPDFCDAYISAAKYDLGEGDCRDLTQDELDWLNSEHTSFVYEQVIEWIH